MISIAENIDISLASVLEYSEAAYWSKLYDNNTNIKCLSTAIAGAQACAMPELDILAMNRVVGLGMEIRVQPADIDRIIRFYANAGSNRFFIQLSPYAQQEDLADILYQKGLRPYNSWVKMLRPADNPVQKFDTDLKVLEISPEHAHTYGNIIFSSFDWEDERLAEWLAASVGKPGYYHYVVKDGEQSIAAGALHIVNQYASMALAGTLPECRGKGAQSLLLRVRLLKAKQLGCHYIISETAEDKPDQPVASYRNMRRFGFEPVYLKQNWIYEF